MVIELNILRSLAVRADEVLIPGRSLVLRVPGEHALQAHTDALNILNRTPSLLAKEVEADDAVGIDVRVDRDRAVGKLDKDNLGRL